MARVGLFGFANSGKTTLFNALTGLQGVTAAHPYTTRQPNIGVAQVFDPLLEQVAVLEGSTKVTHPSLDLVDLPALGGAEQAKSLALLRETDAAVAVLQAHDALWDGNQKVNPASQAEDLLLELCLADHEVFERRSPRIAKQATAQPEMRGAAQAVAEAAQELAEGQLLRRRAWSEAQLQAFRDMAPLTLLPVVWVLNIAEDAQPADLLRAQVSETVPTGDQVFALPARLEEEVARLSREERQELYDGYGLGQGAPAAVMQSVYAALSLITFYTVGPKESRAWSLPAGSTALDAAGKIHSDLARGFIRAEVGRLDKVVDEGGWDAAKGAGAIRLEGKNYVVSDGDVITVRFSI